MWLMIRYPQRKFVFNKWCLTYWLHSISSQLIWHVKCQGDAGMNACDIKMLLWWWTFQVSYKCVNHSSHFASTYHKELQNLRCARFIFSITHTVYIKKTNRTFTHTRFTVTDISYTVTNECQHVFSAMRGLTKLKTFWGLKIYTFITDQQLLVHTLCKYIKFQKADLNLLQLLFYVEQMNSISYSPRTPQINKISQELGFDALSTKQGHLRTSIHNNKNFATVRFWKHFLYCSVVKEK